jgi:hypothetical protein
MLEKVDSMSRSKLAAYFYYCLFTLFVLFGVTLNAYTQQIPFSIKEQLITKTKQRLDDSVKKQTEVEQSFILGRGHSSTANKINHPYFNTNDWVKGYYIFKNQPYAVENLKYDIENDRLIYLKYSEDLTMNSIELDHNFISEFCIQNAKFRFYWDLKNNRGIKLKDGYYEVAYDGVLKFLIRREKMPTNNENQLYLNYTLSTEFFLLNDGRMIRIKSITKLINQLTDKKKAVKMYVRNNSLKLNSSDYSSAVKVLKFYESL